jgi:hypothetical protein
MNETLQGQLVKELRLRGISSGADGDVFLPAFMADYSRRFGRVPREAHDAHRPLRGDEDLDHVFEWQEDCRMSRDLVVHFKRRAHLVTPTSETLPLGGMAVRVREGRTAAWGCTARSASCAGTGAAASPGTGHLCSGEKRTSLPGLTEREAA